MACKGEAGGEVVARVPAEQVREVGWAVRVAADVEACGLPLGGGALGGQVRAGGEGRVVAAVRKGGGGLDAAGGRRRRGRRRGVGGGAAGSAGEGGVGGVALGGTSALDGRFFRGWREEALAGLATRVPVVEGCSSGCSCESQNSAVFLVSGSPLRRGPRLVARAVDVVPHVLHLPRRAGRVVGPARVALRARVPDHVHLVVRTPRRPVQEMRRLHPS